MLDETALEDIFQHWLEREGISADVGPLHRCFHLGVAAARATGYQFQGGEVKLIFPAARPASHSFALARGFETDPHPAMPAADFTEMRTTAQPFRLPASDLRSDPANLTQARPCHVEFADGGAFFNPETCGHVVGNQRSNMDTFTPYRQPAKEDEDPCAVCWGVYVIYFRAKDNEARRWQSSVDHNEQMSRLDFRAIPCPNCTATTEEIAEAIKRGAIRFGPVETKDNGDGTFDHTIK